MKTVPPSLVLLGSVVLFTAGFNVALPAQWNAADQQTLNASNGSNGEYFGYDLAVSGDVAIMGAPYDDDGATNAGSAFIFRWDGLQWTEEKQLLASDGWQQHAYFGYSVDIDADLAVVGAYARDEGGLADAGAVYVFRFDGTNWIEEQKLTPADPIVGHQFSYVAVSGNWIAVGATGDDDSSQNAGSVYFFEFNGTAWNETQEIVGSDVTDYSYFGQHIEMDGDALVVGDLYDEVNPDDYTGAAYVFRYDGSAWVEEQKLIAADRAANDYFGNAVSITGDLVAVGAYGEDSLGGWAGAAYVFRFDGAIWSEEDKFVAPDGETSDYFGTKVATTADTVTVTAQYDDDYNAGTASGSAHVYRFDGRTWSRDRKVTSMWPGDWKYLGQSLAADGPVAMIGTPYDSGGPGTVYAVNISESCTESTEQKVLAPDGEPDHSFGYFAAIDGDVAAVSALLDDEAGNDSGAVNVFRRVAGVWTFEQKLMPTATVGGEQYGVSIAISGNRIAVGSPYDCTLYGCVYVYLHDGSSWVLEQKVAGNDSQVDDIFGYSLDLEGTRLAVSAYQNWTNDWHAGAAYVFDFDGTTWNQTQKIWAADGQWNDLFGTSIALSGDWILVGASQDDDTDSQAGSAYFWKFDGSSWNFHQKVWESLPGPSHIYGTSCAIDGNLAVIGANGSHVGGAWSGRVSAYHYDGFNWIEEDMVRAPDAAEFDAFGERVSMDGTTLVVSASQEDDYGVNGPGSGAVYKYRHDGTRWRYTERLKASDFASGDNLGVSVGVSDGTVVTGAYYDDDNGNDSGSAYFFTAPVIGLDADPETDLVAGESLEFRSCPGLPSGLMLLYVIDVNGLPFFTKILKSNYDANGNWSLTVPVPGGMSGLVTTFLVIGVAPDGNVALSNAEAVSFQ